VPITLTDIENAISDAHNRENALYNAAVDLVKKLQAIEQDPSFKGIWGFLHVHNYKYTGPAWVNEVRAMIEVLKEQGYSEGA
jgi:hypothetical protein